MFPVLNVMLSYGRDLFLVPKVRPHFAHYCNVHYVFRLLFRIHLHNKLLATSLLLRAVYRQYINRYHNDMWHERFGREVNKRFCDKTGSKEIN